MTDPLQQFTEWFEAARAHAGDSQSNAMTLATADKNGAPSARIVLLKAFDERGFVFYTNLESRKSLELKENPRAALCFFWERLGRQVRIEGTVTLVSDEEADEYFAGRPFVSRIGAVASDQSRLLVSRGTLMDKIRKLEEKFSETNPPPRPKHWSGWRLMPERIEFWQEGKFRLHQRELFTRAGEGWKTEGLYP